MIRTETEAAPSRGRDRTHARSSSLVVRSPVPDSVTAALSSEARLAAPELDGSHDADGAAEVVRELVDCFALGADAGGSLRFGLVADEEDLYLRMSADHPFDPAPVRLAADRLMADGRLGSLDISHDHDATHVVAQRPWVWPSA